MGSASDPSPPPMRESANKEVLFDDAADPFREDYSKIDRGLMKNANLYLEVAISDEEGKYKVVTDDKYLRKRKAMPHASASGTHNKDDKKNRKVDVFYAQRFKELDLELKSKEVQVPLSVTEGHVAGLTVVLSAEGEPVFKSGLEEHVHEQTK